MTTQEEPLVPAEPPSRSTMVLNIYHQAHGEQPTAVSCIAGRVLSSDEEVYPRRRTFNHEWKPIDLGWVEDPGLIIFENLEGKNNQVIPTPEEAKAIENRVLEIRLNEGSKSYILVRPGWAMPLETEHPRHIHLRCSSESAKCRITVHPK